MGEALPSREDGQLIKGPKNNWVFVLEGGKRKGIPNMDTLLHLGFKLSDVKVLPASDIEQIVMGEPIPDVNSRSHGKVPRADEGGPGARLNRRKRGHELGEHDHLHLKKKKAKEKEEEEQQDNRERTSESEITNTNTSADVTPQPATEHGSNNTTTTLIGDATSSALSWLYQSEATTKHGKEDEDPYWSANGYFGNILEKFKDSWKWGKA